MLVVDLKLAGEFGPEARDKGRAAVGDDAVGETMVAEDTIEENPGKTGSIEGLSGGDEVGVAGETVDNDPDGVVAM